MGHVARAPWDMLQGLHGTCCNGSMGYIAIKGLMRHVEKAARAPCDMLRGLHGTCCEGSIRHIARAPWDMCVIARDPRHTIDGL